MADDNEDLMPNEEESSIAASKKEPAKFEDRVKAVVDSMTQDDKGNWQLPEDADADEAVLYAAKLEKRHRDTQSAFTKANQKAKEYEVQNSRLAEHLIDNATLHLTEDQKTELNNLKLRDPDKWRDKLNEYEGEARKILQSKIDEYQKEGQEASELELRKARMAAFTEQTGIELNDDVVNNQLPASYSKELSDGKIDFETFLDKAHKFLTAEKTIKGAGAEPKSTPNLGKLPGGTQPSEKAQAQDIVQSYQDEIF